MTTMLNTEPMPTTPEAAHLVIFEATPTARTIAMSAIRVAYSDVRNAYNQLAHGTQEEAEKIIAEAREQLEFAANALSGRIWTIEPATQR